MKLLMNVMKKGSLTISKIEGYKTIWSAKFLLCGTKDKEIYFQEPMETHPTYGLRFRIGDTTVKLDRWSKEVRNSNILESTSDCEEISVALVKDNLDWIIRSLCNNTKTSEYNCIYGGYSKGCYELHLEIE